MAIDTRKLFLKQRDITLRQFEFTPGAWFTNEDVRRVKSVTECGQCGEITEGFRIMLNSDSIRKVVFCQSCGGIKEKPFKFESDACGCTPVEVVYPGGASEVVTTDYCERRPVKVVLNGIEMNMYDSRQRHKDVIETWWECPLTNMERKLKYFQR
jgi:hypothetical protein